MARVTVEDCLEVIPNRFLLAMVASKRAKQLYKGAEPLIDNKSANKKVFQVDPKPVSDCDILSSDQESVRLYRSWKYDQPIIGGAK